jgi:DNA-binding MarR family transcriptional regulator
MRAMEVKNMVKLVILTHRNVYVKTFMHFNQVAEAILKYMDNRFYRELRTSFIKYSVLRALVSSGGKLKHTDLAYWTNTKKHNITALVERMKAEDLVSTEWSTVDRRVNMVTITEKGRELYKKTSPLARDMVDKMMRGMKEEDIVEFDRLLDIIQTNVERD